VTIKKISKRDALLFIHKYHYSKIMPRLTKYYLGFIQKNTLVGVVTLGWGTQPKHTIQKIFYSHKNKIDTNNYLEIGKLCFLPSKNKSNFGSMAIALLIKWIKSNLKIDFLYTLADGIVGKCGYIYQASNFRYIGKFKTSIYIDRKTKEKIHPRSSKTLCTENALYENKNKVFWLTHKFCEYKGIDKINGLMFRYIYPLNYKARKILDSYIEYQHLANPKDKDLFFEKRVADKTFKKIEQPTFNKNVFRYNYQKYNEESKLDFNFIRNSEVRING